MIIPGSIPVTGFIAPTDTADTFPVTDAIYGIDGFRSVSGSIERDAVTLERRREGMLVYTQDDGNVWQLLPAPWTSGSTDWKLFLSSGATSILTASTLSIYWTGGTGVDSILSVNQDHFAYGDYSIVGGGQSNSASTLYSAAIGGTLNFVSGIGSAIIGGTGNTIRTGSTASFIGAGLTNVISYDSTLSSIIGGQNNTINHSHAHILGSNITSVSANTTHVESLNIYVSPSNDDSLTQLLARDTDGTIRYRDATSLITGATSGITTTTANNGLTKTGDNITLGGALTGDTYINNSGFLLRSDEFSATTMSAQTTYLTSTSVAQLIMEPVNVSAPADGSMWFTTSGGTTFLNYQVTGYTKSVELT